MDDQEDEDASASDNDDKESAKWQYRFWTQKIMMAKWRE
jgi:hypothetical protein